MSILASDAFTRANATTLGANWTQAKGMSGSLGVESNAADMGNAGAGNRAGSYYSAVAFPNDQYSQALISALCSSEGGITVRSITSGTQRNQYIAGVDPNDFGGATTFRILKHVANVVTSLGTSATAAAAGQTWYLEAQGTSLVAKQNGTSTITLTDASLTAGAAGLFAAHNVDNVALYDDWVGGDFVATGPPPPFPPVVNTLVRL